MMIEIKGVNVIGLEDGEVTTLGDIYERMRKEYSKEDVLTLIESDDDFSDEELDDACEKIAEQAHINLDRTGIYWDVYWDSFYQAVSDYKKNRK